MRYWRLHGAPRTYYSEYDEGWLEDFAARVRPIESSSKEKETWVIFDNTALGHATANAVWLDSALHSEHPVG